MQHAFQQLGEEFFCIGENPQQAPGGIKGVVIPVIFTGEKHVPRYFAGEHRPSPTAAARVMRQSQHTSHHLLQY
jgi:hypothetical protein